MNKKNILVDALQKFGLILLYLSAISCGTSLTATTPMIEPTIPMSVTSDALSATPNQNLLSPTPIITSTPTARLSKEQARELVLELLQPDEDCRFPCWWNIRPGLSEMTSTQSFFNSLSNLAIANRMNDRDGHAFLIITRNEVDMNIDIAYTAEEKQIEWMQVRLCSNVKCDVLSDDPNYLKTIPPYDVSGLLTSYGEPTAIFIFMEKQWDWFSILLFYPDSGTLAEYIGKYDVEGDNLKICPKKGYVNFWFWPIERNYSMADLMSWKYFDVRFLGPSSYYLPIHQATDLDIQSFYNTFKNSEVTSCLDTPADLWPNP